MRLSRLLAFGLLAAAAVAVAQQPAAAKPADNMDILRDKVRADKKLLVAQNMKLTEAEAAGFWPVYEGYQKDLGAINERLGKTVKAFADAYNTGSGVVSNETAKKLSEDYLGVEQAEVDLKKSYLPKLRAVLPDSKVARYLQIETKIRSLVKYEMAKEIPLVE